MNVWSTPVMRVQTTAHRAVGIADHNERAVDGADDLALAAGNGAFDVIGVGSAFAAHRVAVSEVGELFDRRGSGRFDTPLRRVRLDDESKLRAHLKRVVLF